MSTGSRKRGQRERGDELTAALREMPMKRGARGGPPVWNARKALVPFPIHERRAIEKGMLLPRGAAPADTHAVFGQYPAGFITTILDSGLLGNVQRDQILHICSGTLTERWTVDLRSAARPAVIADGRALPFRDETFAAVMIDPPYTMEYSRRLYGVPYPKPAHLLREAARVLQANGRVALLHFFVPFAPAGCKFVNVIGVTTGPGFKIRALTVFEKAQPSLAFLPVVDELAAVGVP